MAWKTFYKSWITRYANWKLNSSSKISPKLTPSPLFMRNYSFILEEFTHCMTFIRRFTSISRPMKVLHLFLIQFTTENLFKTNKNRFFSSPNLQVMYAQHTYSLAWSMKWIRRQLLNGWIFWPVYFWLASATICMCSIIGGWKVVWETSAASFSLKNGNFHTDNLFLLKFH